MSNYVCFFFFSYSRGQNIFNLKKSCTMSLIENSSWSCSSISSPIFITPFFNIKYNDKKFILKVFKKISLLYICIKKNDNRGLDFFERYC